MSDIEQVLARTGRSYDVPPSAEVVEADVRRGRSAVLRRRRRRTIGSSVASTAAVAAIVGAAIIVGGPGETGGAPATGPAPAPAQQPDSVQGKDRGVRLVAYTGEQPDGFFVDLVPEGWYIQDPEHGAYSLAIAEEGDTSHPDDYVGKLVVSLLSSSLPQELPDGGVPVEVNGQPGVITDFDETTTAITLTYRYPDGRYVEVQAWSMADLGWSNDQLVEFAEGVTVTADAKAGVG
jgi:hypothetical protein